MKPLLFLLTAASLFAADPPRLTFTKSFPGSLPAFVSIAVKPDGSGIYNESEDPDNGEEIQLEPSVTRQMFDLAAKLDHFRHPLESATKVANMGVKTFRWEDESGKNEAKFNYSSSEDAKALTDRFEIIGESARLMLDLRRVMKHDRLGVDSAMVQIQIAWNNRRLLDTPQLLPLLDQVAKNESFVHMARERAAELAETIRATVK